MRRMKKTFFELKKRVSENAIAIASSMDVGTPELKYFIVPK